MATEYQLSYTAEEIDERLGMVGTLSEEIVDLKKAGIIIVQDGDTLTIGGVK